MNSSIGINLNKELNTVMKRMKNPKSPRIEKCIYCCDEDYDSENQGFKASILNIFHRDKQYNDYEYLDDDLDDEECCCCNSEMLQGSCKCVAALAIGVVIGTVITAMVKR